MTDARSGEGPEERRGEWRLNGRGARPWRLAFLLGLVLPACSSAQTLTCTADDAEALPRDIPESSGAAWSVREPGVFWTVNDGREGVLYAPTGAGLGVALRDERRPRG